MVTSIDTLHKESGVYCAIHRNSLMCYVGSSTDMGRRRREHINSEKRKKRSRFPRAIHEFGADSFDFEVLEYCDKNKLLEREKFWICFMGAASVDNLNVRKDPTANYDSVCSDVTRERIGMSSRGRKHTPDSIKKMRLAAQSRAPLSEYVRQKAADALRGKKQSPETVQKRIDARKGKKQRPRSLDHANKISVSHKNNPKQLAHCQSMTFVWAGKTHSEEARAKISEALRKRVRKPVSEETKEKIRQTLTGRKLSTTHVENLKIGQRKRHSK